MATLKNPQVIIVDCADIAQVHTIENAYKSKAKLTIISPACLQEFCANISSVMDNDREVIIYFYGFCDVSDGSRYFLRVGDDWISAYDLTGVVNDYRGEGFSTIMFVMAGWKPCQKPVRYGKKLERSVIFLTTPVEDYNRNFPVDLKTADFIPRITEIIIKAVKNVKVQQSIIDVCCEINRAIDNTTGFAGGVVILPGLREAVFIKSI